MLWRDMTPADTQRVASLDLRGIYVERRRAASTPTANSPPTSSATCDANQLGLTGVERLVRRRHPRQERPAPHLQGRSERGFERYDKPATMGASLELTIDRNLQALAEQALAWGVASTAPRVAWPWWPTRPPARSSPRPACPRSTRTCSRRRPSATIANRAAQDIYEPGSTFKIVTASAALDDGTLTPDFAGGRAWRQHPHRVARQPRRPRVRGSLSLRDVVVKSSNVGAIRIGRGHGRDAPGRVRARVRLRVATARDLPWREPRASSGPPASGARARSPRCRWATRSASRRCRWWRRPARSPTAASWWSRTSCGRASVAGAMPSCRIKKLRRVIAPETAALMTTIMEAVVAAGTAKAARIEGYTVAGKTGTAKKLPSDGAATPTNYNASFVGFVPSRRPGVHGDRGDRLAARARATTAAPWRPRCSADRRRRPALPGRSRPTSIPAHCSACWSRSARRATA